MIFIDEEVWKLIPKAKPKTLYTILFVIYVCIYSMPKVI